jgi:hypothetical protein
LQDRLEHLVEGRRDFLRFAGAARRAGPEEDRAFTKGQCGVFDEDRIRKNFKRRKTRHRDAGSL